MINFAHPRDSLNRLVARGEGRNGGRAVWVWGETCFVASWVSGHDCRMSWPWHRAKWPGAQAETEINKRTSDVLDNRQYRQMSGTRVHA